MKFISSTSAMELFISNNKISTLLTNFIFIFQSKLKLILLLHLDQYLLTMGKEPTIGQFILYHCKLNTKNEEKTATIS